MNYKHLICGIALVLTAMLVLPAMACPPPPTCPPGEVWGQTGESCYQVPAVYGPCQNCPYIQGQYGPWGNWECGKCSHDDEDDELCEDRDKQSCPHPDHQERRYRTYTPGHYQCHTEGYVPCDGAHHEKQLVTPAHEQCDPIFGCIPVTCPAIPCESGTHCLEGQCVPDVCGEDFQCAEGFACNDQNQCVEIPRKSGHAYFSNPYWDQVGGCDRALVEAVPSGSLPTTGNGDIVVKAISCIIDEHGGKSGCVPLDGKLFFRENDDGVFLPTCTRRCYFGGCGSVIAMGGYPLTMTAKNPQEKLRAVICKPYGDTYDVFTTQVTFEKPGMETVTMSTKDSCFDQTLSIGAYCGGCRASQSLAAIFDPAWIAPADSPLWDTCQG
jgi:hypothetical protein